MGVRVAPGAVNPHEIEVCVCQNQAPPQSVRGVCPLCDGMGMRVFERADGGRLAEPCSCQHERKIQKLWQKAQVPRRYANCTLENFKSSRGVSEAFIKAKGFASNYPGGMNGTGLLFSGGCGLGKTHLAVGILRKLALEKGTPCLFYDYRDLLKQITNSYNKDVHTTELSVLKPVFDVEVLVLDELGATRPTDWVWDTVALILNARYNGRRTTILTTNFPNAAARSARSSDVDDAATALKDTERIAGAADQPRTFEGRSFSLELSSPAEDARRATRDETLGERIGQSMWSRLQEMCVSVELYGTDYRQSGAGRARFE